MLDYSFLYKQLESTTMSAWLDQLPKQVDLAMKTKRWGDLPHWLDVYHQLPAIKPSVIDLNSNYITIGQSTDCDSQTQKDLEALLRELHPWRKGPFNIFGTEIETEWRSDMKWDRLKNHIAPLADRLVLDIGCGNGYHCWRMAAQNPKVVIGVDPTMLYVIQFFVMQKYIQNACAAIIPLGIDDLPQDMPYFDTIFSMGLLYHRRAPFDHLLQLKALLREGGELVLETLVIEGAAGEVLSPQGRYAKMPNVWFIPSVLTLESWLTRMGFVDVRLIHVTQTTAQEQRATDWMGFQSLTDFLDPKNPTKTIEGYPAPRRAIILANKAK